MSNQLRISDDDHLQLGCHLGYIQSIADIVRALDSHQELGSAAGLCKHTVANLMYTIDSEVTAAEKLLDGAEVIRD